MPPVNLSAAARTWPVRLPAAIFLASLLASCNTTTTYTPSTAAAAPSPAAAQAQDNRSATAAAQPVADAQQSANTQQEQLRQEQRERQDLQRQQEEDQRRQQAQRQQEEDQRRQQAQRQQEEDQRRQQAQRQQEEQRLQAQLQTNRARLAELEREIESSRASAATEARTNAKLIEAISAAEELLAILDAEQAKYTQVDENGQLQEPLQKSLIQELEARKESLLEEVRTLSARVAR